MSTPIRFRVSVLLTCLFALSTPSLCQGIDIFARGSWSRSISSSDLTAGPGSNLPTTFASASDVILVEVVNTASSSVRWHVNIRKTNGTWNSNLHLSAKRTGNGSSGNLTGGTVYQEVTATDVQFFAGRGDSSGITVGLELTNVNIALDPPQTGSTAVTFTVVLN